MALTSSTSLFIATTAAAAKVEIPSPQGSTALHRRRHRNHSIILLSADQGNYKNCVMNTDEDVRTNSFTLPQAS